MIAFTEVLIKAEIKILNLYGSPQKPIRLASIPIIDDEAYLDGVIVGVRITIPTTDVFSRRFQSPDVELDVICRAKELSDTSFVQRSSIHISWAPYKKGERYAPRQMWEGKIESVRSVGAKIRIRASFLFDQVFSRIIAPDLTSYVDLEVYPFLESRKLSWSAPIVYGLHEKTDASGQGLLVGHVLSSTDVLTDIAWGVCRGGTSQILDAYTQNISDNSIALVSPSSYTAHTFSTRITDGWDDTVVYVQFSDDMPDPATQRVLFAVSGQQNEYGSEIDTLPTMIRDICTKTTGDPFPVDRLLMCETALEHITGIEKTLSSTSVKQIIDELSDQFRLLVFFDGVNTFGIVDQLNIDAANAFIMGTQIPSADVKAEQPHGLPDVSQSIAYGWNHVTGAYTGSVTASNYVSEFLVHESGEVGVINPKEMSWLKVSSTIPQTIANKAAALRWTAITKLTFAVACVIDNMTIGSVIEFPESVIDKPLLRDRRAVVTGLTVDPLLPVTEIESYLIEYPGIPMP